MNFSKNLIKKENKDRNFLEELNRVEKNLTNFQTNQYYLKCKQKLQNIPKKLMEYESGVNVTGTRIEKSQLSESCKVSRNPRLSLYHYIKQKGTKQFSANK